MKKYTLLLLLTVAVFFSIKAQPRISFETGLATYDMNYLSKLNNELLKDLPFEAKQISNFDPYWYHKLNLTFGNYTTLYGLSLGLQSTGSRISTKDYSAEYLLDMRTSALTFGFFNDYAFYRSKKIEASIKNEIGIAFGDFTYTQKLSSGQQVLSETLDAQSQAFYYEPMLNCRYKLKRFSLFATGGYQFQLGSSNLYKDDPRNYFLDEKGRKMTMNWSGLRIGLGIAVNL